MNDTPHYIFDPRIATQAYRRISRDLEGCQVHYCLKANGDGVIVRSLAAAGARFEVSSRIEFETVIEAGIAPENILCGLPVKTVPLVRDLYDKGCRYFTFDTLDELRKLERYAPTADKALRLNVRHISPPSPDFGATEAEVEGWVRADVFDRRSVTGLAFDIRQNTQAHTVIDSLDLCERILKMFPDVKTVNIGGNYRMSWEVGDDYYPRVISRLNALRERWSVGIIAEVGRSVVKHAGRAYTRVALVKPRNGYNAVYLDVGLPGGITHSPTFIRLFQTCGFPRKAEQVPCKFFGDTCCNTCLFATDIDFQPCQGDVLELGGMGAYTVCKISRFHGATPPPIYYRAAACSSDDSAAPWPHPAVEPWEGNHVLATD